MVFAGVDKGPPCGEMLRGGPLYRILSRLANLQANHDMQPRT